MNTSSVQPKSPKIAYTVGEPAGIGAELILQLAQHDAVSDIAVIGDKALLAHRAKQLGITIPEGLAILDTPIANINCCGNAKPENVSGVMTMLNKAIDGCISGEFSAIVTGPLHKGIINELSLIHI